MITVILCSAAAILTQATAFSAGESVALTTLKRKNISPQPFKNMTVSQTKAPDTGLKIDGEVFFYFQKYITQASTVSYNKFEISRAYINFRKSLSESANVRLTLDAARLSPSTDPAQSSQYLYDFLKYAYVELPLVSNTTANITAKLGLQQTVWIPFSEKMWGNRYIAKSFTDDEGIMPSADFGIGFEGSIKPIATDFSLTLMNGTGFKNQENNSSKDIALRLNKNILSNNRGGDVVLGGYVDLTDRFGQGSDSSIFGALLGYTGGGSGNIFVEYVGGKQSAKDISGYSVAGFSYLLPEFCVLGRYDYFKPDTSAINNEIQKTILGLSYTLIKEVRIAFDVQSMQTGTSAPQKVAYLHSEIKY